MFLNRKIRAFGVIAALAAAATLSACASGGTAGGETTGAPSAEFVPVQIGVGADAAYAPFFVAEREGLFEAAGLDVTLVPFASGGDAITALNAGQIELTQSSPATTVSQLANNPDLTAFVKTVNLGRYNKAVLRTGVDSPADIKNFGYVAGLGQYMAIRFLEANDIDPASVNMIPAGAQDLAALLQRGDIDGFVLWEPWPANAETAGTGRVVSTIDEFGLSLVNWLITTTSWLDENEATAHALVAVLAESIDLIDSDPDLAADAVESAVAIEAANARVMLGEMDFGLASITEDDVASATDVAEFFLEAGTIEQIPDLQTALVLDWYTD